MMAVNSGRMYVVKRGKLSRQVASSLSSLWTRDLRGNTVGPIATLGKVYFAELKLRKMFLLLSYVNWISAQFYRALNHHAHKPRCFLQEEIVG